jgi:CTP:molybdopterin cytidylyltransferase MocA
MHVVVTAAGHSRRFHAAGYQGPKFLIDLGGKPMIAHVFDMFSPRDHFHVVVNDDQVRQNPEIANILEALARNVEVCVIPPHEEGPTYSALQVASIPDDEAVIVTYCDFSVDWDYGAFLRHALGNDGALAVFRGFHPASFGDTLYAYVSTDGDRFIELREKRSFTSDRTQEYASAGTYYFCSWAIFRRYARMVGGGNDELPEAYVSLLFNHMVGDGLDVVVHEIERFLCYGTPEDVRQYLFWWSYLAGPQPPRSAAAGSAAMCINLVPMAGRGSRFRADGYRVAKPLIPVRGEPMVVRAAASMPTADQWVFLPRAEDVARHPIRAALEAFSESSIVVPVEEITSGQAATCLLAIGHLPDDAQLLIASCDYEVRYDGSAWRALIDDQSVDGVIWTYRMSGAVLKDPSAFAYCRVADDGRTVTEVVEKRTVGDRPEEDPMVVGTFWYRRAGDFKRGAQTMIARGITVGGEYYVGTSINTLLEEGARFVIFDIDQWISFGDPFELRVLEYWEDHFRVEAKREAGGAGDLMRRESRSIAWE